MRHLKKLVLVAVALVVLVVGGTWAYINVVRDDAPERLTLEADERTPAASDGTGEPASIEGTWTADDGSQAGYRVGEVLFGQTTEGVGRTEDVSGTLTIEGSSVTGTELEVDMTTVTSDDDRRDNQFRGRIMDTAQFPTSTFLLTEPIELGELPASGETATYAASGELTLRDRTRPVSFELSARRSGDRIEVQGSIPIVFEEWGIPNPSNVVAKTEDRGELEFLVKFMR